MTGKQSDKRQYYLGVGIVLGIGIGAGLGVAFGNPATGISIGAGCGVALGLILEGTRADEEQQSSQKDGSDDA